MSSDRPRHIPLLERQGLRERQARELWVHVPELEERPLREWCRDVLSSNMASLYREEPDFDSLVIQQGGVKLSRSLDIVLPESCRMDYSATDSFTDQYPVREAKPNPLEVIMDTTWDDRDMLLNIADYLLASELASEADAAALRGFLRDSGSVWEVDEEGRELTRRTPPEQHEAYQAAIAPGDAASRHLQDAWRAAWSRREPSARDAYDGAVKALESALKPIVSPTNDRTTLGTLVRDLRKKPAKWDTRFGGEQTVETLTALLDELWSTQDRHGEEEYRTNTLEEAQDAVTIAIAVVGIVRRGFLFRVEESTPAEEAEDLAVAEAALERYARVGVADSVPYDEYVESQRQLTPDA